MEVKKTKRLHNSNLNYQKERKKERKKTTHNIHFRCSATTQDIRVHNKKPGVYNAKKPNNQQKFMLTLTLKSK